MVSGALHQVRLVWFPSYQIFLIKMSFFIILFRIWKSVSSSILKCSGEGKRQTISKWMRFKKMGFEWSHFLRYSKLCKDGFFLNGGFVMFETTYLHVISKAEYKALLFLRHYREKDIWKVFFLVVFFAQIATHCLVNSDPTNLHFKEHIVFVSTLCEGLMKWHVVMQKR